MRMPSLWRCAYPLAICAALWVAPRGALAADIAAAGAVAAEAAHGAAEQKPAARDSEALELADARVKKNGPNYFGALKSDFLPDGIMSGGRTIFILSSREPDLEQVAVVAILGLVGVALLDILAHIAERMFINPESRASHYASQLIDGSAAFLVLFMVLLWYGIVQEWVMTQEYTTGLFPSPVFVLLAIRFFTTCFAAAVLLWTGESLDLVASRPAAASGILFSLAGWAEETALLYISFPLASIFKSLKVVPVMAINSTMNKQRNSLMDYGIALIVGACVVGFSRESKSDEGPPFPNMNFGLIVMSMGVVVEAISLSLTKKVWVEHVRYSIIQMMFVQSAFTTLGSLVITCFTVGFYPLIVFMLANPECIKHLVVLGLTSTVASYLCLYILKQHGPVLLAFFMVVRSMAQVVVSALMYGHTLDMYAKIFVIGTFLAVGASPVSQLLAASGGETPGASASTVLSAKEAGMQRSTSKAPLGACFVVTSSLHRSFSANQLEQSGGGGGGGGVRKDYGATAHAASTSSA